MLCATPILMTSEDQYGFIDLTFGWLDTTKDQVV